MPFKKGNTIWKKAIPVRKENKDKMDMFMGKLADGGVEVYNKVMGKLAEGKELTKGEQEYMDRFEGWREYIKPKLARTDGKVEVEGKITLSNILDGSKKHLQEHGGDDTVSN